MFNSNGGYSLADIAAAAGDGRNNGAWGEGNGAWWIIILFLFVFCGWGNGNNGFFGGRNNGGAIDGYILTSDFGNIERKIDGVNNGLTDVNNKINGFESWKSTVEETFTNIDERIGNNEITIGEINNKASLVSQMSNAELLFPNPEFTGEKLIDDYVEWWKYQHNNLRLYGVTK